MKSVVRYSLSSIAGAISLVLLQTQVAHAAGIATPSMSVSALGTANSNAAAIHDPSAQYANPASLTRFTGLQVAGAMLVADASIDFENDGSTTVYNHDQGGTPIEGGDAGDPVKPTPIPQTYVSYQFSDDLFFGLAIDAPYAIQGDFNDNWIGRYDGTESQIAALNFNPSIAWKFNRQLSFGFGATAEVMSVKMTRATDLIAGVTGTVNTAGRDLKAIFANRISESTSCALSNDFNPLALNNEGFTFDAACANSGAKDQLGFAINAIDGLTSKVNDALSPLVETNNYENDSRLDIEGIDVAFGFNMGMMYEPWIGQRFGLSYRSKIVHELTVETDWTVNEKAHQKALEDKDGVFLGNDAVNLVVNGLQVAEIVNTLLSDQLFTDGEADLEFTTPAVASFHTYHQLNDRLSLMSDLTWTQWSAVQNLQINFDNQLKDGVAVLAFEDVWRFSLGGEFQYTPRLSLRAGYAIDQSPSPKGKRNPGLPDSDRQVFSFGANYMLGKNETIDFGFSWIAFEDSRVDYNDYGGNDLPAPVLAVSDIVADLGLDVSDYQGVGLVPTTTTNNHTTSGTFKSTAYLVGIQYNRRF
ncbi:OmpP1/FadL family transporter [Pelagibaculum spongiae]|uniref:Aromatic hydrocarbon degradation protein n=1 Tax=Pelagibaculum spongiae TaxID=2080658 RepID=A0A2V1H052_9GAMM|nr:outer membrane protein transport protein [Pelagibaculum spongiae]PVZ67749.1 hypothetical protein DC094_15050 [Pelagibaculum spongiae]